MINLLLGGPGAGKSYESVVFHVLPALMQGRKVITNLPLNVAAFGAIDASLPALIELRDKTLAQPPQEPPREQRMTETRAESLKRSNWSARAFANAEDFASEWRHADGHGPLYVVDECHFCMPVGRTQVEVEEWFSMHRHYNADVLLITQSSGKISRSIRDLVQVCYKVRKAVALGKADGYIRKVLDGVNGGEVAVSERKYQPQYYKLYRSHTQGMALSEHKASDVAPLTVKWKRMTWAFWLVALPFAAYAFWPSDKPKPKPAPPKMPADVQQRIDRSIEEFKTLPPRVDHPDPVPAPAKPQPVAVVEEVPEPYATKGLHVTGRMQMGKRVLFTFAISDGGRRIADVTSEDLARAGYTWEPLTDCAGTLKWKSKGKAITCDAPVVPQGSKADPVVIALPTKAVSAGAL